METIISRATHFGTELSNLRIMKSTSRKAAFTLVELLVVISIILLASSIIFIGGGGGDGAKLSSSQRIVSGIAKGARGQAILKGARTRLIIYTDDVSNAQHDKKLRFCGIVYEDSPGSNTWRAATQGTYLPEGVYFSRELSQANDWPRSTMNLDYPKQSAQGPGGDQYYYYEFNSNGTMAAGFENSWLVLQAGLLRPQGSQLVVDFDREEDEGLRSALIFRRAGTTTPVTDPTQIRL